MSLSREAKFWENAKKISEKSKYAQFYAFYAQIFQNMLAYAQRKKYAFGSRNMLDFEN